LPKREQSPIYDIEGEVALRYYRLQKISEGSISLVKGKGGTIDGPVAVGTEEAEAVKEELSKIIEILNERFKTDFTPADELFIDSVREDAVQDQQVREAAAANTMDNFSFIFKKRVEDLFVDRMEQNEAIAARFLNDPEFQKVVYAFLLKQVYEKIRKEMGVVA
jgi:type I restriction enzyme R subunit